jgi:hypothetical protein
MIKRSVCGFTSVSGAEHKKANTELCTKNWLIIKLNCISILQCPSTNSIFCFRRLKKMNTAFRGSNSDGGNFAHSKLGKYLETHQCIPVDKQLPRTSCLAPQVIVGDEAFPLKPYCYPGSQSKGDNEKSNFNCRLSRARRVVENTF